MKKIIAGKLYNTDTAKLVGGWDNHVSGFSRCWEDLYIKRTGEYFLHGEGGPMTKYAEYHGNETSGSSKIFPFSYDDAKKWAEENLGADEFLEHFGTVAEGDGTCQLNVKISESTFNKLNKTVSKSGKTKSFIIEELISTLDD